MIITRSPLRISLGGGGTDLPSYYREHTGFLIAAAIDKYVYITLHEPFTDEIIVKYSKLEIVREPPSCSIRSSAKPSSCWVSDRTSRSPASPTFRRAPASALPAASPRRCSARLHVLKKSFISPRDLAEQACHIEIDRWASRSASRTSTSRRIGGITCFTFHPDDTRDGRAADTRVRRRCITSRTTCAVLHRLHPQRLRAS